MEFHRPLCLFFVLFTLLSSSQAHKFYVGGSGGWTPSPSENYNQWSGRNRFQVNDTIVFKYKKGSDSVLEVKKEDYDKCNKGNPMKKFEEGDTEFKLDRPGPFYFISGKDGNCEKGQKLIVVVITPRKQTPPPSVPTPTSPPKSSPSPPAGNPPSVSPSPKSMPPVISPVPAGGSPASSPISTPPAGGSPASSPAPTAASPSPSPTSTSPEGGPPASSPAPAATSPSPSPTSTSPAGGPPAPSPETAPTSPSPMGTSPAGGPPSPGVPSPSSQAPGSANSPAFSNATVPPQGNSVSSVTPWRFSVLSVTVVVSAAFSRY